METTETFHGLPCKLKKDVVSVFQMCPHCHVGFQLWLFLSLFMSASFFFKYCMKHLRLDIRGCSGFQFLRFCYVALFISLSFSCVSSCFSVTTFISLLHVFDFRLLTLHFSGVSCIVLLTSAVYLHILIHISISLYTYIYMILFVSIIKDI